MDEDQQTEQPVAMLGRISLQLENAEATNARLEQDFRRERRWRRIAFGIAAVLAAGLIAVGVYAHQTRSELAAIRVILSPDCPAKTQLLGCENHEILVQLRDALSPASQAKSATMTANAVIAVAKVSLYAVECEHPYGGAKAFEACVVAKVNSSGVASP